MKIHILKSRYRFQKWYLEIEYKNGKRTRLNEYYWNHNDAYDTAVILTQGMATAVIIPFKI